MHTKNSKRNTYRIWINTRHPHPHHLPFTTYYHLFIYLFIYLLIYLFIYLFIYLQIYLQKGHARN